MTEDEAKTKWCPFARQVFKADSGHDLSMNRDGSGSPTAFCIDSACMAWRWENKKQGHDASYYLGITGTTHTKETAAMEAARFYKENPLSGHCGLAGTP